jgi:hypothetical protein
MGVEFVVTQKVPSLMETDPELAPISIKIRAFRAHRGEDERRTNLTNSVKCFLENVGFFNGLMGVIHVLKITSPAYLVERARGFYSVGRGGEYPAWVCFNIIFLTVVWFYFNFFTGEGPGDKDHLPV